MGRWPWFRSLYEAPSTEKHLIHRKNPPTTVHSVTRVTCNKSHATYTFKTVGMCTACVRKTCKRSKKQFLCAERVHVSLCQRDSSLMQCSCPCTRDTPHRQGIVEGEDYVRCACRLCGRQTGGHNGCHYRILRPLLNEMSSTASSVRPFVIGKHLRTIELAGSGRGHRIRIMIRVLQRATRRPTCRAGAGAVALTRPAP